ncbi:MAG: hypothetical protein E7476_03580 [Ruminococcaceae bacterium]|nr:hypothetical protein [Oscillospiraceae bacterium]
MSRSENLAVAKPILFNTEMVQAILEGRKTATRRVIKPPAEIHNCTDGIFVTRPIKAGGKYCRFDPYEPYQPGDILYVQETWKIHALDPAFCMMVKYRADDYCNLQVILNPSQFDKFKKFYDKNGWQSPYFMPKEAARIFLRVTDVRVERLQEIDKYWSNYDREGMRDPKNISIAMQERFISIWNSTIKKADLDRYGWDANPWVWVIQFERIVPTDEN